MVRFDGEMCQWVMHAKNLGNYTTDMTKRETIDIQLVFSLLLVSFKLLLLWFFVLYEFRM